MRKNISKLEKLDSKFLFVTPSEVTGIILFPENTERNEREKESSVRPGSIGSFCTYIR